MLSSGDEREDDDTPSPATPVHRQPLSLLSFRNIADSTVSPCPGCAVLPGRRRERAPRPDRRARDGGRAPAAGCRARGVGGHRRQRADSVRPSSSICTPSRRGGGSGRMCGWRAVRWAWSSRRDVRPSTLVPRRPVRSSASPSRLLASSRATLHSTPASKLTLFSSLRLPPHQPPVKAAPAKHPDAVQRARRVGRLGPRHRLGLFGPGHARAGRARGCRGGGRGRGQQCVPEPFARAALADPHEQRVLTCSPLRARPRQCPSSWPARQRRRPSHRPTPRPRRRSCRSTTSTPTTSPTTITTRA